MTVRAMFERDGAGSTPQDDERQLRRARMRVLAAEQGAVLVDLSAAARCSCRCHPQPGQVAHSGTECACQMPRDQRLLHRRETLDRLCEMAASSPIQQLFEQVGEQVRQVGRRLGAEAELVALFPVVVVGAVGPTPFRVRFHHGFYEVAVGEHAVTDPYSGGSGRAETIRVLPASDGTVVPQEAAVAAIEAVKEHNFRSACQHERSRRFCPDCGAGPLT